jgi:glutamine synthetase
MYHNIVEYIWIGGKNEIRSKTRIVSTVSELTKNDILEWNYDGSSTWQADSNGDTEILLKPCALFKNPLRTGNSYLILCDTYKFNGEPTENNHRCNAFKYFYTSEYEPWFGIEQEYFIEFNDVICNNQQNKEGYHYCGLTNNKNERNIVEKHLKICIDAGVKISGINAEVSNNQWEFQIGPCVGIDAGDHLIVARYLLDRIAEEFNAAIIYHPKPISDINGSGCHINFSTNNTRNAATGLNRIHKYIYKLSLVHSEHIQVYGADNHLRLTGNHETSSIDKFSWGIGTRNTSIRIPNSVVRDGYGYFEDRRPASNIDPYLATMQIYKTCCTNE